MQPNTNTSALAGEAPRVPGWPLVGSLPHLMRRGALAVYMDAWARHGDVFRIALGPRPGLVVVHPSSVTEVLVVERHDFIKAQSYENIRMLTGNGLLTLEGSSWRKRRRLAQPAFHSEAVRSLVDSFVGVTRAWLDGLRARLPHGGEVEAHSEMTRLTFDVVAETLLDLQLGGGASGHSTRAFGDALEVIARRGELPFSVPRWLPTPGNLRLVRALRVLDPLIQTIVTAAREPREGARPTLLSMLASARDADSGEGLSDRELRDEVVTIVLAGHETTALLLTWSLCLLDDQPEVVARMRAEVEDVLGGREPRAEDLPRLVYLRQVIDETLRLRPPAWILGRDVARDTTVAGYPVRAGELVMPVPYLTHRHPDFWPDPERFDPERFTPEASRGRPSGAYVPFSAGPRTCIGSLFTLAEAQVVLAMLLQQADFGLASRSPIAPDPRITLRPGAPVPLRLRWRDGRAC